MYFFYSIYLLASSTITAIALAVIGFLGKSIFTQIFSRDIEKFKSDLQKSAFEHQTRYQSLHGKRAEVIAELYNLLVQAEHDAMSLASLLQLAGEPPQEEKNKQAIKSGKTLYDFFEKNRIYFKPESCERISNFIHGLNHSLIDFGFVLDSLAHERNPIDRTAQWVKVWDNLTNELHPIKADIEEEFRGILGL